jgi:hypothetical protein
MSLGWFAFTTAPNRERAAIEELGRFATETRLPVGVKEVRRGRKASAVRKRTWPLLVGYAFAAFARPADLAETIAFLQRARELEIPHALRRIVATPAGRPLELRRDRQGRDWFDTMDYSTVALPDGERPRAWVEGDGVRVVEGPFEGFEGVVSVLAGERLKLLLDLFGRTVPVEMHARDVVRSRPVPVDTPGRRSASGGS